jgi:hypothetical protein
MAVVVAIVDSCEIKQLMFRELIPTSREVHPATLYFYAEAPLELMNRHHLSLTTILYCVGT